MTQIKNEALSKNFNLHEMLRSQVARRQGGEMLESQMNPDRIIIRNLGYLVIHALQPLRTLLKTSIMVNSGYRCELLNTAIGGSSSSQHVKGMAADMVLSNEFLNRKSRERIKDILNFKIQKETGLPVRGDVNSNFYLFAAACLYAQELDIDQLIHEYGEHGQPDWVHLSCGVGTKRRRQILVIAENERVELTLREALMLGCK